MELRSPSAILARLAGQPADPWTAGLTARLRCATGLRHVPSSFPKKGIPKLAETWCPRQGPPEETALRTRVREG